MAQHNHISTTSSTPFYNVNIFRIYIAYLRHQLGWNDEKVEQLFDKIGSESSALFYEDNWFDQDFADKFYTSVCELTGDNDIAHKVGAYSIDETAKGLVGRFVSSLLSPEMAYRNIDKIGARYTRAATAKLIEISNNKAVIRSVVSPGCVEKAYQCRNRIGMLESVPTLFNLPKAHVAHPKCLHRGDEFCEYDVTWISHKNTLSVLLTVVCFAASIIAASYSGMNLVLSFVVAIALASGSYALLQYKNDKLLKKVLTDQIEALKISAYTIEHRNKETLLRVEINNLVSRIIQLQELCDIAAEAIHDKMGYERVTIFLVNHDRKTLSLRSYAGVDQKDIEVVEKMEFHLDSRNKDGFLLNVVNTCKPLFVRDVEAQKYKLSERSQRFVDLLDIKSFVAVPIVFEHTIYGVIAADNSSPSHLFTSNDMELLTSVANPIAVAISNAIAYEQLQKANDVLEQRVLDRTVALEKAKEDAEKAKDEAEKANEAKGLFLANMSHELRTPLNAIIGYSELIKYQANEDKLSIYYEDAQKIEKSGKHLLYMITSILDLSKIEAGRMELDVEEFDLSSVIEAAKILTEPLAHKNNNKMEINVADNISKIHSDETKIKQIVINLLTNACKFTFDGMVKLDVYGETVNGREHVVFEVTDTGIGIPQDKIGKLFKDFVQVDSSTTKKYGGTGLGLSLCKKLSELMQGTISVSSNVNAGSRFTVKLPRSVDAPDKKVANTHL